MKRVLIALTVLVGLGVPTVSRANDSACFMKTSSGRVMNLGAAYGEAQSSAAQVDAAFIANYKRAAGDPIALKMVSITKGQDWAVRTADKYCEARRKGLSRTEVTSIYAHGLVQARKQGISDKAIRGTQDSLATIVAVAPKYYCPEFAGR